MSAYFHKKNLLGTPNLEAQIRCALKFPLIGFVP